MVILVFVNRRILKNSSVEEGRALCTHCLTLYMTENTSLYVMIPVMQWTTSKYLGKVFTSYERTSPKKMTKL